jgi:hypothetical protein
MKEENEESKGGGFMALVSLAVAIYLLYLGVSVLV